MKVFFFGGEMILEDHNVIWNKAKRKFQLTGFCLIIVKLLQLYAYLQRWNAEKSKIWEMYN